MIEPRSSTALEPRTRAAALIAAYLLLGALALSPLLAAAIPPLVDFPNHLARMVILLHAGDASAGSSNYVASWRLLPNLAMDIVVPALAQLMPVEAAARLFVAVTMALLVAGTVTLHRALFGRVGLWPLASLLFLYNAVLWWGFVSYLFGLAVALLAFSAWIASARWRIGWRIGIFAAVAAALFVLHLFAFGAYGLLVAAYEIGNRLAAGRRSTVDTVTGAALLAQFVPAGILWLGSQSGPRYTEFGGVGARIYGLLAPTAFGYPPSPFDALLLAAVLIFVIGARRAGVLGVAPAMRVPIVVMMVAAALMPEFLHGSWAAQIRLPVALAFVLVASTRLTLPRRWPVAAIAGVALALLGVRVWVVAQNWQDMDGRFAELRAALKTMPEGVRLLAVQSPMPDEAERIAGVPLLLERRAGMAYWHMPALAVIDRDAFIVPLFTGWYPVEPSPRNAGLPRMLEGILTPDQLVERASPSTASPSLERNVLGETPCCFDWPRTFDFVLWIDFGQAPPVLLPQLLPWASGSFFHIYRVTRP